MKLFEEYKLGDLIQKNRIAMAPMTRRRADGNGNATELMSTYYLQRASAGLIISEAINISRQAMGVPNTPGLYTDEQVDSWLKVTRSVHEQGGLIFAQLWHTGRVSHSIIRDGELPVAPSAVRIPGQRHFTSGPALEYEVPRALSTQEVKQVIQDFRNAAENAKKAGFDGVELHGANGYLPNQFLVDGVNLRTDEYGGTPEGRIRFVLEVLDEMIKVWGKGRVGLKLSPSNHNNGISDSDPVKLYNCLIQKLNDRPLAFLHLSRAAGPMESFPDLPKDILGTYSSGNNGTIIAEGGYDHDSAETDLSNGQADIISFGVKFISNPDLPRRLALNAALNSPDRTTFYDGGEKGYTDYPFLKDKNEPAIR